MEPDHKEQVALHRWAVIAEATSDRLSPQERGAVVRQIAARTHAHPDGSDRRYSTRHDRPLDTGLALRRPRCPEARHSAPTPERCAPIRSCSEKLPRCASRSRAAQRPRSPRSSITATASQSPSGPSATSCAAGACSAKRSWQSPRCSVATRPTARTRDGSPTC